MPALPPIAPVDPTLHAQPMQVDAFQSVLNAAGAALKANPDAIGQTLLSELQGFRAHEASFRATVEQATNSGATPSSPTVAPIDGDATASHGISTTEALQKGQEMERQSMGMMMQTYSFALEATLVTNAATTFTSSINTLIKTQ